jgi:hydroxymethylglutaryl-CoA reductase
MLDITTAAELTEIIFAVGLAQNVAGLRVLATEGVQRDHMALHSQNVAVGAGAATADEIDHACGRMVAEKAIRLDRATEILAEVRNGTR